MHHGRFSSQQVWCSSFVSSITCGPETHCGQHQSSSMLSPELFILQTIQRFVYFLDLWNSFRLSGFTYWFVHFLQGVVEPCVTNEGDNTFKSQSNRKPVCDFIRILLMDSLLNVSANTDTHPLNLQLEVKALAHITSASYLLWFVTLRITLTYQHTDNTDKLLSTCIPTEKGS